MAAPNPARPALEPAAIPAARPARDLGESIRRLVHDASAFVAAFPRTASFPRTLLFGLVCLELATLIGGLLMLAGVDGVQGGAYASLYLGGLLAGQDLAGLDLTWSGLGLAALLVPVVGTLLLLAGAVTAHLIVIVVVGDRNAGFRPTFRAIAFASVVNLVNWLPVVGLPLNLAGAYLASRALCEAHRTATWRAALVGFAPAVAAFVFLAILRFAPE